MTYIGDTGEVSADFHGRDEVESLTYATSGTHVRFVAPGSVTRGQYGLFEWNMRPHTSGADAHFHKTFSESFFVTAGYVELFDGAKWVPARPGDFLYVPMGGIHGAPNSALVTSRMRTTSGPITGDCERTTARSIVFSSSRTLPGQSDACSACITPGAMPVMRLPARAECF